MKDSLDDLKKEITTLRQLIEAEHSDRLDLATREFQDHVSNARNIKHLQAAVIVLTVVLVISLIV